MPVKLSTTIKNIQILEKYTNIELIQGFYEYLKANNTSEIYQNRNIKALLCCMIILFVIC
jgi:hypothetical protein